MNVIRGRTCPWNTFAIWDVKKLALTGFPLIGDGIEGIAGKLQRQKSIEIEVLIHIIKDIYRALLSVVPSLNGLLRR